MKINRRQALLASLFGAGGVGLRAIATGLPVSFFLNPRKAMAAGADAGCGSGQAQYTIFSTSERGDPLNAGVPGSCGVSGVIAAPQTADAGAALNMTPTSFSFNGQDVTAVYPWYSLFQSMPQVVSRTVFFHLATNIAGHDDLTAMRLGSSRSEMLPSLLAKAAATPLNTIQAQPVLLSDNPREDVTYDGAPLSLIAPSSLKDTLLNPSGPELSDIANLQALRDSTMKDVYNLFYQGGTPTQRAYITALANTQTEARQLSQTILQQLGTLPSDSVSAQIQAAILLIQLNVAPVFTIHIPFGSDNHVDAGYVTEATETVSGVGYIGELLQGLKAANLQDKVTFMSLNTFGRTLSATYEPAGGGRVHNPNHQVSVCIGAPFRGGVIGGCTAYQNDFGAMNIDPMAGGGLPINGSGIAMQDTLAAFGKTMLAAVGGDPTRVQNPGPGGTAQVVCAALA